MLKAILFDLDGTLTDTFKLWCQSVMDIVKKHTGDELSESEYRTKYWGMDSRGKIRSLITQDEEKIELIYSELQQTLIKNAALVKLFLGAKPMLENISKKCKLAVISNSSMNFLEAQLSATGISQYFSAKIADALPKPNPDGLLRACMELGINKNEALFVGDSKFDIGAGKNAGQRISECHRS